MQCEYCDSIIGNVPESGICPHCGAPLPKQAMEGWAQRAAQSSQPAPHVQRASLVQGINCCGRCMGQNITYQRRGYSWGWGIFWGLMVPVFGLLFGFVGSNTLLCTCQSCGHKWKRT